MKIDMYIMTLESISKLHIINTSHLYVCLYVYSLIVARQRLGRNMMAAKNTHATIQKMLDASFSTSSVSDQRIVGD
jgi:hypothetical protein